MDSFSFIFTINKTYRNAATHPITIPKRHYKSLKLNQCRADRLNVNIVGAGRRIQGWLYRGYAGFGEYFQLRMSNHEFCKLPPSCVKVPTLNVQVRFVGEAVEVQIQPAV